MGEYGRHAQQQYGLARSAWSVARAPALLPQVLGRLLHGAVITWHPDGAPAGRAVAARLRLADPAGGVLIAERTGRVFAVGERLGARMLVLLARRPQAPVRPRRVRLPGGGQVAIRPSGARDRATVAVLYALCGPLPVARGQAEYLVSPRRGIGLLARDGGRPVGWAGLLWDEPGAEMVLLIAPAWWDRGLGDLLLRQLVDAAWSAGVGDVWLHTASGDDAAHGAVSRLGLPVAVEDDGAGRTLMLRLKAVPAPAAEDRAVYPAASARVSPVRRDRAAKPSSVPGQ
ncbi:GNAT family N-acetyltransferase [Streptomyces formicae]